MANAQGDNGSPWYQSSQFQIFVNNYIKALEKGDDRYIARSIQAPSPQAGWDEGVAAIIANTSKQQLKALRLNKSPQSWSFKTIKASSRNKRRVAILIPSNKMNPKLAGTSAGYVAVMTHPYFANNPYIKQGVVFEVEVTFQPKTMQVSNPKIIVEGHNDPLGYRAQ